jgi:myo-inositol-1(or 4)-monophosphatase
MEINLLETVKEVEIVAKKAGAFILNQRKKFDESRIESKGLHDYVSYVDKESEQLIINGLATLIQGSGFIAEEGTTTYQSQLYNWIIDPLDGTTNFIHGLPPFCISIGLSYKNEVILGVIYEPNLDELFSATKNGGAFLNGKKIKVSNTKNLDNSLLATGFPYYDYSKLKEYMKVFEFCMQNTRGVRRLGSAAIDLAYVACGRMDGFFEYGLQSWDVAAGSIIVSEAGGIVTDFNGNNNSLFGKEILAFNPHIHQEFKSILNEYFK